jgi:cystathionine beta-lyase/cystathionine gamma-synthase
MSTIQPTATDSTYHDETRAVHAGVQPDATTGAIMTPIFQTSTYVQSAPAQHNGYEYSRTDNPTRTALQEALAALEQGAYALAFASGMAATDTLMRLLKPGDEVICGDDVYGGTYRLFEQVIKPYGINFHWIDLNDLELVTRTINDNTRMIWLETPTNPNMCLADIAAICELAPDGVQVVVDNTFASPILQKPLTLGADIVLHSTTKYIGGHSDVVGGAIVTSDIDVYERLKFLQNAVGAVPGPMDCFLTLRGIKTLAVRMERHSKNALQLARVLEDHPRIERVLYPGLESHPQYEIATRQMTDYGGMISVIVNGSPEDAAQIVSRTTIFALAESLGGVESLIEHPYSMTHASTSDSPIATDPRLIRLSVGIENVDDLREDLLKALG